MLGRGRGKKKTAKGGDALRALVRRKGSMEDR